MVRARFHRPERIIQRPQPIHKRSSLWKTDHEPADTKHNQGNGYSQQPAGHSIP